MAGQWERFIEMKYSVDRNAMLNLNNLKARDASKFLHVARSHCLAMRQSAGSNPKIVAADQLTSRCENLVKLTVMP